ncbi:MAG: DUF4349 domain-containing protein [Chloroflexota bacterium]|nr:DUF4349 domain-containing protein [Chloroflexota bacterium]
MQHDRRSRRLLLAGALVSLIFVLGACASGASLTLKSQNANGAAAGATAAPEPGTTRDLVGAPGGNNSDGGQPLAAPLERQIIKTGEITIQVSNVANTLGRVRAMALELGGYVGGSQAGTLEDAATLTLRIPAARFDDALAGLHGLDAKVVAEATRESDVSSQIVDLEARIANLEASESSYRALLERAQKVEDILAVQSRLDQVRGEIEQLKAQHKDISGQADLATLTVTLTPVAAPIKQQAETWDLGAQLSEAVATLVSIGQGVASALIVFVVVWVPVLLVLGIIALLLLRGVLEARRRFPIVVPQEPPAG